MITLSDLTNYNPSCYLPNNLNAYLPSTIACPPPSPALTIFQTITSPITSTYNIIHTTMNTLIGLPFLSFLLIPTMTSYSTSLNLLFFYITWSTLILTHPPLRIELISSLVIKLLFYILPSVAMLTLDLAFPSLSSSLKRSNHHTPLSTNNLTHLSKFLSIATLNPLLGILCQAALEYLYKSYFSTSALRITTTLPLPWGIAKDLLKGLLARDALTWLIHKSLHRPPNNSLSHDLASLHKTWYHKAVKTPFPLSPSYDHPVIYLLKVFLPMYLPAMVWRFHALTYMIYLAIVSLEELFAHSGYAKLPTNFVVGGIARRMDVHCQHRGGNFGTWGVVDWVMGTGLGREAVDDLVDEAREGDLGGKVSRQAGRNVKKVEKVVNGRRRTRARGSDSDE